MKEAKESGQLKRILVPVDFSAESKFALRYAANLARDLGAGLFLLRVVEPLVSQADFGYGLVTRHWPDQDALRADCKRINALAQRFRSSASRPIAIVRSGDAETEILEVARDISADLIVIGRHDRSTGGTADRVVQHAPCPILVVRKKKLRCAGPRKRAT